MITAYLKLTQSVPDVTSGGRAPILNDPGMWLLKVFCVSNRESTVGAGPELENHSQLLADSTPPNSELRTSHPTAAIPCIPGEGGGML